MAYLLTKFMGRQLRSNIPCDSCACYLHHRFTNGTINNNSVDKANKVVIKGSGQQADRSRSVQRGKDQLYWGVHSVDGVGAFFCQTGSLLLKSHMLIVWRVAALSSTVLVRAAHEPSCFTQLLFFFFLLLQVCLIHLFRLLSPHLQQLYPSLSKINVLSQCHAGCFCLPSRNGWFWTFERDQPCGPDCKHNVVLAQLYFTNQTVRLTSWLNVDLLY